MLFLRTQRPLQGAVAVARLEAAPYMGLPRARVGLGGLLHGISTEVSGIACVQGWELVLPQVTSRFNRKRDFRPAEFACKCSWAD